MCKRGEKRSKKLSVSLIIFCRTPANVCLKGQSKEFFTSGFFSDGLLPRLLFGIERDLRNFLLTLRYNFPFRLFFSLPSLFHLAFPAFSCPATFYCLKLLFVANIVGSFWWYRALLSRLGNRSDEAMRWSDAMKGCDEASISLPALNASSLHCFKFLP